MSHLKHNIESTLACLEGAYAPNTLRSYMADLSSFVDWCEANSMTPLPLTEVALVAYTRAHMDFLKISTLRRRLVALRRVNRLMGFQEVPYSNELFLEMRRASRMQLSAPRQARGINRPLLLRMINAQPPTPLGKRNRALLSLGYDFLARRSELAALQPGDIQFTKDGALRGIIRRSKMDQFGSGRLVYGSTRSAKLLRAWLQHVPQDIDWIFCPMPHGVCENRPLSGRSISNILKLAVVRTKGERPREQEVSGHSLRVGAAQDLLIEGHDIGAIMRAGGWKDLRVASHYLRLAEHNIWKGVT